MKSAQISAYLALTSACYYLPTPSIYDGALDVILESRSAVAREMDLETYLLAFELASLLQNRRDL